MVRKLLKYEFSSLAKTILPMEIVLFSIALFTRFVQLFEGESTAYTIFIVSSSILLGVAMVVCVAFVIAVCVVRFYKNLFTAQGYLTLTLPATHTQHIAAKLISAFCASVVSIISVIAALAIATAGDVFHELVKAGLYILKIAFREAGAHVPFYVAEFVLMTAAYILMTYLLFYACVTVGQLAKKNRVLAAFGAYFAYYVATQILGTVVLMIFTGVFDARWLEALGEWISEHGYAFLHILLCGSALISLIWGTVCFFISRHIMQKKLNLE